MIAEAAGREVGRAVPWSLVYCSRSGPPQQPWLEPDVNDHLRTLHAAGVPGVAVAPIGEMQAGFDALHRQRFEIERLRLAVTTEAIERARKA